MSETSFIVPAELFAAAESSSFSGTYEPTVFKAGPDLYTFAQPLSWQVSITNTGGALLVIGTVEGDAVTSCARCMEPVKLSMTGEIEGYYLLSADDEADLEDIEEDEFEVLGPDNVIDLVPLIRAAILLECPLVPLCDEECKGLCPACGKNLNEGDCDCVMVEEDGRDAAGPANPFAVLKDYPFQN
ncbi:MAG: DUF177 domain-containing protein [Raoultibacter sp.]